jgi:hypothetical protein
MAPLLFWAKAAVAKVVISKAGRRIWAIKIDFLISKSSNRARKKRENGVRGYRNAE